MMYFLAALFLLLPGLLQAGEQVTARYTAAGPEKVVVEISVQGTPPASAILIQQFPQDAEMINARPKPNMYNRKKNKAKWLLRDIPTGTTTITADFDGPVSADGISGELRYKSRLDGKMRTIRIGR
ncbi:MAG: hypothetical protein Kow0089_18130 [Desulfobulbaceae bacterium]